MRAARQERGAVVGGVFGCLPGGTHCENSKEQNMESATKYSRRNIWRASQHGHASVGCDHWELKQDGSYRPVRKSAARAEQTPEPGAAPISLEWARAKSEL